MQHPLRGDRVLLGLEGGFTVGWEGDTGVVAVGNGSALLVSDNDVLLLDVFVGPYLETFVGQRLRLYAGAGPVLQFARADLEYVDQDDELVSLGDSGFGAGLYARAGLEVGLQNGSRAGFGVRWIDSRADVGGGIDEVEFEAVQYAITVTTGF